VGKAGRLRLTIAQIRPPTSVTKVVARPFGRLRETGAEPQRLVLESADRPVLPFVALFAAYAVVLFLVSDAVVVAFRGHTENTESTLYVLAFGLVMPVSFALAWLVSSVSAYRQNVDFIAAGAGIVAGLGILGQRLLNHQPLWEGRVLLALTAGCLVAVHVVGRRPPVALRTAVTARRGLMVLGASCVLAVLAAAPGDTFAAGVFWRAAAAAGAALLIYQTRRLGLPRWLAVAVDLAFAAALVMTLTDLYYWDLTFFEHSLPYLGTVNDVLHGRTVLVNTVSQYGVAVIYFLAAIFKVIPERLGTFMLLLSALTAIQFIVAYCTLLAARTPRGIAVAAVAIAVFCTADFSLLTANTSPLRFGPPYVLVGLAVLARTRRRFSHAADFGTFLVVGLASIWSLEAFGEVAVAFLATEAVSSITLQPRLLDGVRRLFKRLGLALLSVVVVQVLFAVITRLAAGAWPDWAWYLQLVSIWTVHQYGDLPVARWSAGFLLAGLYMVSAGSVALLVLRRRALAEQMLPGLVAIAGYTAFGIAMFSYFVGRSHPFVLWDVAAPGIILLGLWLGVLVSLPAHLGRYGRTAAIALAGALGLILFYLRTAPVPIIRAYSVLSTVAGEAAPGVSVGSGLEVMWSSPPTVAARARRDAAREPVCPIAESADGGPLARPKWPGGSTSDSTRQRAAVRIRGSGFRASAIRRPDLPSRRPPPAGDGSDHLGPVVVRLDRATDTAAPFQAVDQLQRLRSRQCDRRCI